MTNNQLYEAIFRRKSIRKYDMTPLPAATLSELQKFASNVKPLDEKIKYEFSYLGTADVKNLLPTKAPHYICLYSEKKGNYLMNAGFLLQQIDLYLSANDLGSCWLGMAKPSKQMPDEKNGLEFVIMLAFGNTNEPVHRTNSSEFIRNSLSSISNIAGADDLLEPVRHAPSASNTQPWLFSGNTDEIIVSREKLNLIKAPLYGKINQIDIGIALCHLWLSLDNQGKSATFDFDKAPAPSGYEFMTKVKVGR
jgi:nitroreductase